MITENLYQTYVQSLLQGNKSECLELQKAMKEIKVLRSILPICMHCKKIRDDKGYWNQLEAYIAKHTDTEFSHSICQECAKTYYPDIDIYDE